MIVQETIDRVLAIMGDPNKTFFTQGFLYESMKEILDDTAKKSRTLLRQQFIAVTDGTEVYALNGAVLAIDLVEYNDGDWYPLTPGGRRRHSLLNYRLTAGRPSEYSMGQNSRILRVSGTATGGSPTTLAHTGVDFPNLTLPNTPPQVSDLVFNTTDDSEGFVANGGIANGLITLQAPGLRGGSDNTFASGDTYEIHSYNAPNQSIRIWPGPTKTDTVGTESLSVWACYQHYNLDVLMAERGLNTSVNDCTLETELPYEFDEYVREKLKAKCIERRKGVGHVDALRQDAFAESKYQEVLGDTKSRIEEPMSTWLDHRIAPQYTLTYGGTLATQVYPPV